MRCHRCNELQTSMWGNLCNKCRREDEKHAEAMKSEKDNHAYQKGYSDGFKEGQTAGLELAEKAIGLGTQVRMEMKIKSSYCLGCKYESDKRYCHMGILMKNKKYCKYK